MDEKFAREESIRQYLLGMLSEGESSEIEQDLFFDEELSRTADLIEDEIIEQYLDQELDPHERTRMKYFLRPAARREKLDLARLLRHGLESLPSTDDPPAPVPVPPPLERNFVVWLRNYGALAAAGLFIVSTAYFGLSLSRANGKIAGLTAQVQQLNNSPMRPVPLAMTNGVMRGRDPLPHIVIPQAARTIKVDLVLPGRFAESFKVALQDKTHDEAEEIWSSKDVPPVPSQPRVLFDMPTQGIRTGTYDIVVSDQASNSSVTYSFNATVSKSPGP